MSEQNGTNVSTKPQRGRKTKQSTHAHTLQHPANDDKEAWKAYWKEQGQPWRTEPEIDIERQLYLEKRRNDIKPDERESIYPFSGIKLNRADVEWLLATHENGRGPVDWSDESQREREGLDLRGADLRQQDLSELPLAKLLGGISWIIEKAWTEEQQIMAALQLDGVNLSRAHLEGANLNRTVLKGVNFNYAKLEGSTLCLAHIEDAEIQQAHLKKVEIILAHLKNVLFFGAKLEDVNFSTSQLEDVNFEFANLHGASFIDAQLDRADFYSANLEGAHLLQAKIKGTNFRLAKLNAAHLGFTQLEGVDLRLAQLDGADLMDAVLANSEHIGPRLADIQWGDVNLAVVDWSQVIMLGDECVAHEETDRVDGERKGKVVRLYEYKTAARAYRQLSIVLRNQGLNEDAARFAYRAQRLQRKVFWRQRKFGQYLFSGLLDLLAGYGYRFWHSFFVYAFVIVLFAAIYYHLAPHLLWYESIVISMTAFHGRGFFPTQFNPGDPQAIAAAIEALVGLFIEITLIATLTQRLFGK